MDTQKILTHKMAKTQKQRSISWELVCSPGWARWGWIDTGLPSLPSSGLAIQHEETNMKFQRKETNKRLELKTLSACLLPIVPITRNSCIIYAAWVFYEFYLKSSLFGNNKHVFFKAWLFSIHFRGFKIVSYLQVEIFKNFDFNL